MPEENRKPGFTLIETMILIAILAILALIFVPQAREIYWKKAGDCENVLDIHETIAPDIDNFVKIFELPEGDERTRKLEEFKASESGRVFFDEFCPALLACKETLEIEKDYPVPLKSLCAAK